MLEIKITEIIKSFFQVNQQKQVTFNKIVRYLRYYPKDLWLIFQFFIRHTLSCAFRKENSNKTYIEHIYQYFLKTTYSEKEIDFYLKQLENGEITRITLLFSFLMIPASLEQKFFHTQGILSHHQARLQLVQKKLPTAELILDLGGGSGSDPSGSLMMMGYPYQPERIDIIDLPNEKRFFKSSFVPDIDYHITPQGTQIHYHYMSMTNLTTFQDATFDLVWSGQSIEHITPAEATLLIQEVYRIVKPGGHFCLDTPNRKLTLLQVREGFVHPEHKIEYVPSELIDQLIKIGFVIVDQKAVSPMPMSHRTARFNRLELIHSKLLGDNANLGYSFYLQCQKPLR